MKYISFGMIHVIIEGGDIDDKAAMLYIMFGCSVPLPYLKMSPSYQGIDQ